MIEEFWYVFTDPAHIMAEVMSSLVWDVLIVALLYPFVTRRIRRLRHEIHQEIDEEHGVVHAHDGSVIQKEDE